MFHAICHSLGRSPPDRPEVGHGHAELVLRADPGHVRQPDCSWCTAVCTVMCTAMCTAVYAVCTAVWKVASGTCKGGFARWRWLESQWILPLPFLVSDFTAFPCVFFHCLSLCVFSLPFLVCFFTAFPCVFFHRLSLCVCVTTFGGWRRVSPASLASRLR